MTPRDLTRLRLQHQQILRPVRRNPAEVVAHLGAMQAQDFAGTLWSVGLRTPDASIGDMYQAITSRRIVRTWLLRGTLHFTAPEDVRWILDLVAPRIVARYAGRHRQLGLTPEDFTRSSELFTEVLSGGAQCTRDELFRVLEKGGISPFGQRGYHLLVMAGLSGQICFGSPRGKQQTFVLLDEWVPEVDAPGAGHSPAMLAERYFTGHGPATLQDFSWWSGLTAAESRAGIRGAGSRLVSQIAGGNEYFSAAEIPDPEPGEIPAFLLPGYDEYIVGYRDRSAVFDTAAEPRTVIGINGMLFPTVIVDGSVTGTWKRTMGDQEISLALRLFSSPKTTIRHLVTTAGERYGKFMGLPVTMKW